MSWLLVARLQRAAIILSSMVEMPCQLLSFRLRDRSSLLRSSAQTDGPCSIPFNFKSQIFLDSSLLSPSGHWMKLNASNLKAKVLADSQMNCQRATLERRKEIGSCSASLTSP